MSYHRDTVRVVATRITRGERKAVADAARDTQRSMGSLASAYIREGLLRDGWGPSGNNDGRWVKYGLEHVARDALADDERRLGGGE